MERVLIALIGVLFGFALPYVAKTCERVIRARRIKSAVHRELLEANEEIQEKLKWLGRDVSEHLREVDEDRVVEYKGKKLFLGEREEFNISCKYWDEKFSEIVEVLSKNVFSDLSQLNRLVVKFVVKFKQMKAAFETEYGKKELMALACYENLQDIGGQLNNKLKK